MTAPNSIWAGPIRLPLPPKKMRGARRKTPSLTPPSRLAVALSPRGVKLKCTAPLPTSLNWSKPGPVPPASSRSHQLTLLPRVAQGNRIVILVSVCWALLASSSYSEPLRMRKPRPAEMAGSSTSLPRNTASSAAPEPSTVPGPAITSRRVTGPRVPIRVPAPMRQFSSTAGPPSPMTAPAPMRVAAPRICVKGWSTAPGAMASGGTSAPTTTSSARGMTTPRSRREVSGAPAADSARLAAKGSDFMAAMKGDALRFPGTPVLLRSARRPAKRPA